MRLQIIREGTKRIDKTINDQVDSLESNDNRMVLIRIAAIISTYKRSHYNNPGEFTVWFEWDTLIWSSLRPFFFYTFWHFDSADFVGKWWKSWASITNKSPAKEKKTELIKRKIDLLSFSSYFIDINVKFATRGVQTWSRSNRECRCESLSTRTTETSSKKVLALKLKCPQHQGLLIHNGDWSCQKRVNKEKGVASLPWISLLCLKL